MSKDSNKIIVKVGDKSTLRFANSRVYRAITTTELQMLLDKHSDCHIVIIEKIEENEQEQVKEIASAFRNKDEMNDVLFFIPDNDDITSGIADELDYNIYLNIEDIYKAINVNYGLNTSIKLDDRKQIIEEAGIPDDIPAFDIEADFESITAELGEDSVSNEEALKEESENYISDDNIQKYNETVEKDTEDTVESAVETVEEKAEEDTKVENDSSETEESSLEEKEQTTENIENNEETSENTSEVSSDDIEHIKDLKMQLKDAKEDYNEILSDMKKATARITSLEDVIRILESEKEEMVQRYNNIVLSDEVFEDPISLAEYSDIKNSVDELKSKIAKLESTIESLNDTLAHKATDIENRDNTIKELRENETKLNEEIEKINSSIASGEAFSDERKELESQIASITSEKEEAEKRENETIDKLNDTQRSLEDATALLSSETNEKNDILGKLNSTLGELAEIKGKLKESENKVGQLEKELEKTQFENDENSRLVKEHSDKIAELEKSAIDTAKQTELANNSSLAEKNELETKISKLEAQLTVTKEQLAQKEEQYNNLVSTSGVDESGASVLLETNKTLENISKTLREQLASTTAELEQSKMKESDAQTKIRSLTSQVERLQSNLNTFAASGGGTGKASLGNTDAEVASIQYRSHSQIITVFGSGSFGITTTAMSIANKLASSSKVLYIDFDLVSPMADSWFQINPMVSGINGLNNNDIKNSGLGIFIEHGLNIFNQNLDRIIRCVQKTKGGGLHYLSGLYYYVDSNKLAGADFSGLFNLLAANFQYIICDLGRLGSSAIGDSLITAISNIAYKNIVVTTTNYFEIRNFKTKLTYNQIYLDRVIWLLNMCQKSNIEPNVKKLISPCNYDIMPKIEQFNQTESFTRNFGTRDRFGAFLDRCVFSR